MRHFSRWLCGLLLTCGLGIGCRGGSTELPVVITEIRPGAAPRGSTVTFEATVAGGTPPYTYSWTFTAVGSADSTSSATPHVLITGDVGTETVELTVSDSRSGSDTDSVSFEITNDTVSAVTPSEAGLPLSEATFVATVSGAPDSLEWEFGLGADPSTFNGFSPTVTLTNPGTYVGTVTPTYAAHEGATFSFEYVVTNPVPPQWQETLLGPADFEDGWVNLIEHNDRLVAIYVLEGDLMVSSSRVSEPADVADWDTHVLGPGYIPAQHCVVSIAGRLAVAYLTNRDSLGSRLRLAVSQTESPRSSQDWETYNLPPLFFSSPKSGLALAKINESRLILAFSPTPWWELGGMRVAISETALPAAAGEWTNVHEVSNIGVSLAWPNLLVRDQDILLSTKRFFSSEVIPNGAFCLILQSTQQIPESITDWEAISGLHNTITHSEPRAHDLGLLGDKPWIALGASSSLSNPHSFGLLFSTLVVPQEITGDDWIMHFPFGTEIAPNYPVLIGDAAGRPAVVLPNFADQNLWIMRSTQIDPTNEAAWVTVQILDYGATSAASGVCSAVSHHDRITIAIVTDDGLKIVQADGPF